MPKRKRLRLFGFDYGLAWWYFVTACAARRGNRFGVVQGERVRLNRRGTIVAHQLGGLPLRLEGVQLDTWIVMPDHVHAILVLEGGVTLGQAVAAFKAGASRDAGESLWQRGYWDRIIRDEDDLAAFRHYIRTNPARWTAARLDPTNPL